MNRPWPTTLPAIAGFDHSSLSFTTHYPFVALLVESPSGKVHYIGTDKQTYCFHRPTERWYHALEDFYDDDRVCVPCGEACAGGLPVAVIRREDAK